MKTVTRAIKNYILYTDRWLWLFCLVASAIGVVLLYAVIISGYAGILEISRRNLAVQCAAIGIGIVAAVVLSVVDYHIWLKASYIHVPLTYGLVLLTFLIGVGVPARPDDKRWLILPLVNVWLQPAELLKISFIIIFAMHLAKVFDVLNEPKHLLGLGAHALVPVVLIHLQGDTGSALLILIIAVSMVFVAGVDRKYILGAAGATVLSAPLLWRYVLNDFQRNRILTIIYQETADIQGDFYQQHLSKISIGIGGVSGRGLGGPVEYVPAMHTDFIFSFLCQVFGFIGGMGIVALMTAICIRVLMDARRAEDRQGMFICVGVSAMLASQFIINVGMCLAILPVVGNTFPFLSYGGSSIVTTFVGIGLVLSVHMKQSKARLFT